MPENSVPLDDSIESNPSRRRFLRNGLVGTTLLAIGGGVVTAVAGFFRTSTERLIVGPLTVRNKLRLLPVLHEDGGLHRDFFLAEYPATALPEARKVYGENVLVGMEAGVVALSRRCPHLGDQVVWCDSVQWFECPSHGAQFNAVGEKKGGPAPSGMDLFEARPTLDGQFEIDNDRRIPGMPIGIDTTGQQAEGPHCVSGD